MSHLEPRQYRTIFRMSFLSIGSAVYAMYRQYYMLALCPAGVLFTSINYWRKPEPWSRTLDMTYVLFALTYQLYKAYHAQYRIPYYMITFVSGSMYPLALYYSSQNSIGILLTRIVEFMFWQMWPISYCILGTSDKSLIEFINE